MTVPPPPHSTPTPMHNPHRRLTRLFDRYPARWVWAGFVFVNSFISLAIIAYAAQLVDSTLIFPSLGPTAFLFFYRPLDAVSSPRNAICGHALGIVVGFAALWLFGLQGNPGIGMEGVSVLRIFCAGLALATTCALMILLNLMHPPAASTTLIVALGAVSSPLDLLILEIAVIALTVQGVLINRLEGIEMPLWRAQEEKHS
jgi:CBS domain-containing membrane protein